MPDKTADSLARILSLSSQAPPSADSDGEHLAPAAGPEPREQGLSALSWHGEDAAAQLRQLVSPSKSRP